MSAVVTIDKIAHTLNRPIFDLVNKNQIPAKNISKVVKF